MGKDIIDECQPLIKRISNQILWEVKKKHSEDLLSEENHETKFLESLEKRSEKDFDSDHKPILIVVTTPKSENQFRNSSEFQSLEKLMYLNTINKDGQLKLMVDLEIVSNNKKGLSEVYNRFMTDKYEDYFVCFIHDDVIMNDINLFEKLQAAHKNHEIVGVAGATKIRLPLSLKEQTAWHLLCIVPDPVTGKVHTHSSGSVTHQSGDRYWSSNYGKSPQECRLIDGVFMSFDISKCLKYNFQFDERFTFHHYDLAASLKAAQCGLSITTWPISIQHNSMGDINNQEWLASHRKFINIYQNFNTQV